MTPSLTIGTIVRYNGNTYRLCGITPVSVQPTMVSLEDLRTGARQDVPLAELDRTDLPFRSADGRHLRSLR